MSHEIHRVTNVETVAPFTLRVAFEDGTSQVIDFRPVLHGELYGPLQDQAFFDKVRIDPEAHTLVWPNGADFDPRADCHITVRSRGRRRVFGRGQGILVGLRVR